MADILQLKHPKITAIKVVITCCLTVNLHTAIYIVTVLYTSVHCTVGTVARGDGFVQD